MPFFELEWNWFYVTIVSIVAIFVIGTTSHMISHWEDKKLSDARVLILGTGIFGLLLLLFTVDFKITILFGLILANTILAGLMAVDDRFTTSDKPWELYVMLSLSVAILIGSLVYFYYNTSLGKALQEKQDRFSNYVKELPGVKAGREERAAKLARRKNAATVTNPVFDPNQPKPSGAKEPKAQPRPSASPRRRVPGMESAPAKAKSGRKADLSLNRYKDVAKIPPFQQAPAAPAPAPAAQGLNRGLNRDLNRGLYTKGSPLRRQGKRLRQT